MFRCALLLSCALITACGLKGPLYLPDRSAPASAAAAPRVPEATPTPAVSEPPSNVKEGEDESKTKQAK